MISHKVHIHTKSPAGIHKESIRSCAGVHEESIGSPAGVQQDLWGSVNYSELLGVESPELGH